MNSQYETLYGVGLLDDLHNYFPAILYEPHQFHTVPALLRYVHQQTRNRFDLFSLGQREYRSRNPPSPPIPVPPPPTSVPSVRVPVSVSSTSDLSGNAVEQNSTLPTRPLRSLASLLSPQFSNIQYTLNITEDDDDEDDTANAAARVLASLFQLPPLRGSRLGPPGGLDAFLQPVPVRPTEEQITSNTTVGNLVSDTEHTCTICQDSLTAEQEGRKLNACGHWFHRHCIDTWLEGNVHCPVCRHDIREPATQQTNEPTP